MPTTWTRRTLAATVVALAVALTAGCSGDDSDAAASEASAPPVTRDLATYDVFVLASAENNPAAADVYGIRFNPFAVDRITTDKRVSGLGADDQRLVVAAADENVDRLAQVDGSGQLLPVPGLGRPFAYTPNLVDGVMYFDDAQGDEAKGENRFFAWDLKKRTKKLLFQSKEQFGSATPLSGGRLVFGAAAEDGKGTALAVRNKNGKLTRYSFGGETSNGDLGRAWFAATLVGSGDQFGDKPEAMVLLDPDTGKKKQIPGLQFIAWNPDGTQLLARRTDSLNESKLVLLDPAKPNSPVDLQTVPGLAVYSGSWVRGDAQA